MLLASWLLSWLGPVAFVARLALATVFLASGFAKLQQADAFTQAVQEYGILPSRAARSYAVTLPWVEMAAALFLLVPETAMVASVLVLVLLAVFAIAVVSNLWRGRVVPCACFGAASDPVSWRTLARQGLLGVAAVTIIANCVAAPAGPLAFLYGSARQAVDRATYSATIATSLAHILVALAFVVTVILTMAIRSERRAHADGHRIAVLREAVLAPQSAP